jgi:hypothetical protein
VAVPRHLADGEEFEVSLRDLLATAASLFQAVLPVPGRVIPRDTYLPSRTSSCTT